MTKETNSDSELPSFTDSANEWVYKMRGHATPILPPWAMIPCTFCGSQKRSIIGNDCYSCDVCGASMSIVQSQSHDLTVTTNKRPLVDNPPFFKRTWKKFLKRFSNDNT